MRPRFTSYHAAQRPFKGHRLTPPESFAVTTKDELLGFLKTMMYYRRFETMADNMYKERLIRGFCHLYDGQVCVVALGLAADRCCVRAALRRRLSLRAWRLRSRRPTPLSLPIGALSRTCLVLPCSFSFTYHSQRALPPAGARRHGWLCDG